MHIPVLREKVLEYLAPKPNKNFIDCTIGSGGHAMAILEHTAPEGKVLAIDWDHEAIERLKDQNPKPKIQNRLVLREGNFAEVKEIARQEKFRPVHGVLFDLGFSSEQMENKGRGFSFLKEGPLDMRYSQQNPVTAAKLLNYSSKRQLRQILKEYGEEEFAEKIAEAVVRKRAQTHLRKTSELVQIVKEATPKWYHGRKIHPATKTFQALRIATNNELENIRQGLKGAAHVLSKDGKIAVISFQSLEDRIIKEFFSQEPSLKPMIKKPITPPAPEIQRNPRARSAKLRVAIKR